jgi:VanZ family protein
VRSGRGAATAFVLALLVAAGLSYATEVTQHLAARRHPSLKDWLMNTLGAAAGALLAALQARGLAAPLAAAAPALVQP